MEKFIQNNRRYSNKIMVSPVQSYKGMVNGEKDEDESFKGFIKQWEGSNYPLPSNNLLIY